MLFGCIDPVHDFFIIIRNKFLEDVTNESAKTSIQVRLPMVNGDVAG